MDRLKIVRIYYRHRNVKTVPRNTLPYSLFNEKLNYFDYPSKEDIIKHQIVITTLSTALILQKAGCKGIFSHIFIDEAGQALEVETVSPLTMSDKHTCIVLAGDHKQMSPTRHKFNHSLLERLFLHYRRLSAGRQSVSKTVQLQILLAKNFRSHPDIVEFIASVFYEGSDRLLACSPDKICNDIPPLAFHETEGEVIQRNDSTSFCNIDEVEEVVNQVKQLCDHWPADWGKYTPKDVGVVSPYIDQVVLNKNGTQNL